MPTYKLTYFRSRGLGEVSRQLFHLSGTPFEDIRISQEDWPDFKKTTPFGQMPLLEVDGKILPQSQAIARFLARQFGYAGKGAFEEAWVDAIGDQFKDYFKELVPFILVLYKIAEGDQAKLLKEIGEPTRDKFYPIIEEILGSSSSGYLVGDSLTWVDLLIADHVDIHHAMVKGFLSAYPKVLAHRDLVYSNPKLAEWIEKRPHFVDY